MPDRGDRRELRRRLRLAARSARAEQVRATESELRRLSEHRAQVARLCPGPTADSEVLELVGGARFLLTVRDASTVVLRLERLAAIGGVRMDDANPCFGRSWYRLRIDSSGGPEEITARVVPFTGRIAPARKPEGHNRSAGEW